uniref:Uncharacterized protein n=1 Tax=Anguilla anguilla TaxID=7936 RepID=A0A0E9QEM5_ANGAN
MASLTFSTQKVTTQNICYLAQKMTKMMIMIIKATVVNV